MNPNSIAIVEDDAAISQGLGLALAEEGFDVRAYSEAEGLLASLDDEAPPGVVVSDVRLGPGFGFEGLDLVRELTRRSIGSRCYLMTGFPFEGLAERARFDGALCLLNKPFVPEDLLELLGRREGDSCGGKGRLEIVPSFDSILAARNLSARFLPTWKWGDGMWRRIGAEGLIRGPQGTPWESPLRLFSLARRSARVAELDMAACEKILDGAKALPNDQELALNLHPDTLSASQSADRLLDLVGRAGFRPERLVVEVVEEGTLEATPWLSRNLARLRAAGVRIALDDFGEGRSNFDAISLLAPDILKLGVRFVRGAATDLSRLAILGTMVGFAARIGADLLAEGVESTTEEKLVRSFGIDLAQGYLLGRPVDAAGLAALPLEKSFDAAVVAH